MASFHEIIVEGSLTKKKFHVPQEPHVCGNCGTEYTGYYCPNCGQKYNVERLTFASILNHAIEGITGFTPNLPRTLVDLFYRPGYLVRDYIQQKRRDYSNPFSTVLILAAAFTLFIRNVYRANLTQASMVYGGSIYGANMPEDLSPEMQAQIEAEFAEQEQLIELMMNFIFDNYGIFLLASLFIMVGPMWIAFRSRKGSFFQLNLCECTTAAAYYTCFNLVIGIAFGWLLRNPNTMDDYMYISYGICIPMLVLMLWQLYQIPMRQFLWRVLVFMLLYFLFFVLFSLLLGVGFVIYSVATGIMPQ